MFKLIPVFIIIIFSCSDDHFVLKHTLADLPKELDPSINLYHDKLQICAQIYETLFKLDHNYKSTLPNIAQKCNISDNGLTYTLYITPNIRFHDGTPLTSHDVAHSITARTKNSEISKFLPIQNIQINDTRSLTIKLSKPASFFIHYLASPYGFLIHKAASHGEALIGTGPYKILTKEKDKIALTFNQIYRNKPKNRLKYIIFKQASSYSEIDYAIEKKEADIIFTVAAHLLDRQKWLNIADFHVQKATNIVFLGFNNKNKPVNNKNVRKAILYAHDISKLVYNQNRGNAHIACGPLPPVLFKAESPKQEGYHLQKAKALLKSANIDSSIMLNYYYPAHVAARLASVEATEHFLQKIGIHLNVKFFHSWAAHDSACKSHTSHLFLNSWKDEIIGDPWHYLYSLFHSASRYNVLNYNNTLVDQWLNQALIEINPEIRNRIFKKIYTQVIEDTPAVFLYHVIPHFAYNHKKIKKMVANPYDIVQYHLLELY